MFACALSAHADDKPSFALIEKLPERETAAKKTAHEGWDSGVTPKMMAATAAYNDTLTAMVTDLASAYYGKAKVTKEDVAGYVKTLKAAAEFRHRLDNPTAEDRGTLDALEAPSVVSNDLEDTVDQMVEAVSEADEHFDFSGWEKRWNDAKKTGDDVTPKEPDATDKDAAPTPDKAKDAKEDKASTKRDKSD